MTDGTRFLYLQHQFKTQLHFGFSSFSSSADQLLWIRGLILHFLGITMVVITPAAFQEWRKVKYSDTATTKALSRSLPQANIRPVLPAGRLDDPSLCNWWLPTLLRQFKSIFQFPNLSMILRLVRSQQLDSMECRHIVVGQSSPCCCLKLLCINNLELSVSFLSRRATNKVIEFDIT